MNWLHFALGIVLAALQTSIKNPKSLDKERKLLTEIRDLLNEIMPPEAKANESTAAVLD